MKEKSIVVNERKILNSKNLKFHILGINIFYSGFCNKRGKKNDKIFREEKYSKIP